MVGPRARNPLEAQQSKRGSFFKVHGVRMYGFKLEGGVNGLKRDFENF